MHVYVCVCVSGSVPTSPSDANCASVHAYVFVFDRGQSFGTQCHHYVSDSSNTLHFGPSVIRRVRSKSPRQSSWSFQRSALCVQFCRAFVRMPG
jgi:hypothetical protein